MERNLKVVDPLTPLVDQQRRRLGVRRLYPGREESALVRFVPEILVQIGVRDLLQGLDVVDGHQVAVEVHELHPRLLDSIVCKLKYLCSLMGAAVL